MFCLWIPNAEHPVEERRGAHPELVSDETLAYDKTENGNIQECGCFECVSCKGEAILPSVQEQEVLSASRQ